MIAVRNWRDATPVVSHESAIIWRILDEVGTEVWQMCDGHTSVATMIDRLRDRYKLDRKEAEVSLLSYLKTLGQKRFVGFLVEGEKSRSEKVK